MHLLSLIVFAIGISIIPSFSYAKNSENKIIIAHRGASGYLPEHTLSAKALAYGMGAHYIEQDVVMTKDDQLVVLHDLYLERVTNVADLFPDKKRNDNHYYVIDFTLAEIKKLKVHSPRTKHGELQYPQRFPLSNNNFLIPTLSEEIELIQGLNFSTGKDVGLYVEIKAPWFHHQQGKDIAKAVLIELREKGYRTRSDKIFIQSFDANELKRIKDKLFPELNINLSLVQLIADTKWQETQEFKNGVWQNYSYDWMFTKEGIKEIASYAQGIGPWFPMLIEQKGKTVIASDFLEATKESNLLVHPYTFRADDNQIPSFSRNFAHFVDIYLNQLNVDGIFTDHPDQALKVLKHH